MQTQSAGTCAKIKSDKHPGSESDSPFPGYPGAFARHAARAGLSSKTKHE